MADLVQDFDLTTNQEFIKYVKKSITMWADKIPGHGLKDLGNQVVLNSIFVRPTHGLTCQTQYEQRLVVRVEEPYTNQKISELKYTSTDQLDPWKVKLNKINAFQDKFFTYSIPGSHEVHTCSTCSGNGHVTCPTCKGNGKTGCSSCHSSGQMSCRSCGGRGNQSCTACGGSGIGKPQTCGTCSGSGSKYDHIEKTSRPCPSCGGRGNTGSTTCRACNGSGQYRCSACGGSGNQTCTTCKGSGQVTCNTCKGRTTVTCERCKGHKKMVTFLQINHKFSTNKDIKYQNNSDITKKYPGFKISPDDYMNLIVFEETTDRALSILLLKEYRYITPLFQGLVSDAISRKELGTYIIQQSIKVTSTDVIDVEYEFRGNKFNMLIYGQHGKVYAKRSPIRNVRDDLWIKADTQYKKGEYIKSYENLQATIGMSDNMLASNNNLKDKVVVKINSYYKLGVLYGTIISAYVFVTATLFFLKKPRFFIPNINRVYSEYDWAQSVLPITVCAIFILLIRNVYKASNRFCANYCLAKIKSGKSRVLAGAIVSSFFVFLLWLTVVLGNATGITIIFSYLGYYAVQLFQFVSALF